MKREGGKLSFFASCADLMASEMGGNRHDAIGRLLETGALDYLNDNWERLQGESAKRILDYIADFLDGNPVRFTRVGFLKGQIHIPADYYRMGERKIIKMFEADP